jgi:hypothetical protein
VVDRDAFGRLLTPPERLTRLDRVDCLRRLSGRLQAASDAESQWLGRCLVEWFSSGGRLEKVLGVAPPRGDRRTAARMSRDEERDALLLRLATTVGSSARASRVLLGTETVPVRAADLVRRLREMRAPTSVRAFNRARAATNHGR